MPDVRSSRRPPTAVTARVTGGPRAVRTRWLPRLTRRERQCLIGTIALRFAYFAVMRTAIPAGTRAELTPDADLYRLLTRQFLTTGATHEVNSFPRAAATIMRALGTTSTVPVEILGVLAAVAANLLVVSIVILATEAPGGRRRHDFWWLVVALGLYPSGVYFTSTDFVRDAWILLFSASAVYLAGRALWTTRRVRTPSLIAAAVALAALFSLRDYAAAVIAAGIALWAISEHRLQLGRRLVSLRLLALTAAAGATVAVFGPLKSHLTPSFTSFEAIKGYRAQYFKEIVPSSLNLDFRNAAPPVLLARYLYSLVSNAIGPLPWQVRSASLVFFFVEAAVLVALGWQLVRLRRHLGPRGRLFVWLAVVHLLVIGVVNDNLGTAARLRIIAWMWLAGAYAVALARRAATNTRAPASRPALRIQQPQPLEGR